jgi:hypothetical protein
LRRASTRRPYVSPNACVPRPTRALAPLSHGRGAGGEVSPYASPCASAKFGSVLIYNTASSQGDPDGDSRVYIELENGSGTLCADASGWTSEQFYVYWQNYC